jgi:hypothetical protein
MAELPDLEVIPELPSDQNQDIHHIRHTHTTTTVLSEENLLNSVYGNTYMVVLIVIYCLDGKEHNRINYTSPGQPKAFTADKEVTVVNEVDGDIEECPVFYQTPHSTPKQNSDKQSIFIINQMIKIDGQVVIPYSTTLYNDFTTTLSSFDMSYSNDGRYIAEDLNKFTILICSINPMMKITGPNELVVKTNNFYAYNYRP